MPERPTEEQLAEAVTLIDWGTMGEIHQTLYCWCGGEWRGHHVAKNVKGVLMFCAKDPCPDCGKRGDVRKSEGDPETY